MRKLLATHYSQQEGVVKRYISVKLIFLSSSVVPSLLHEHVIVYLYVLCWLTADTRFFVQDKLVEVIQVITSQDQHLQHLQNLDIIESCRSCHRYQKILYKVSVLLLTAAASSSSRYLTWEGRVRLCCYLISSSMGYN